MNEYEKKVAENTSEFVPGSAQVSADHLTEHKRQMLVQSLRNGLQMAADIGRHRTLGGEDTAMTYALHGLAEGLVLEMFEIFRMVDHPDIPSPR